MKTIIALVLFALSVAAYSDECHVNSSPSHYSYQTHEETGKKVLKEESLSVADGALKITIISSAMNRYRFPFYGTYCYDANGNIYTGPEQNTKSELVSSVSTGKAYQIKVTFPNGQVLVRTKLQFESRGFVLADNGELREKSIFTADPLPLAKMILAVAVGQVSQSDYEKLTKYLP